MRILYVANIRLPTEKAHGIQIMKTCEALGEAGQQVTLVIPRRLNDPQFKVDPYEYYGVEKNFNIQKVSGLDPIWLMSFPGGMYTKVQAIFFLLGAIPLFIRILNRRDVVVLTRDVYLLRALHWFFPKVVWEAHDLPRRVWLHVAVWKRCFRIVSISNGLKQALVGHGVPGSLVTVVPDGVDVSAFRPALERVSARTKLDLLPERRYVVYAGHLYAWKGIFALSDAARQLPDGVEVLLVGGTAADTERVSRYLQQNGISNVRLIQHQPPSQIPLYLWAADCIVIPNSANHPISRVYTSPLKVFEAMASGTPIVASDLPSLRELLNEQNAILVRPDDSEAFAQAIIGVLEDQAMARQRANQAAVDVQRYSWKHRAVTLGRLFQP